MVNQGSAEGRWGFLEKPWYEYINKILCDFDRASRLICGNKMPTRCNR